MAAGKLNLNIEQGATFFKTFTLKDSLGVEINLTGYTFSGKIRQRYDAPSVVATFTCAVLNQTSFEGQFTITLTAAETAAIPVDPSKTVLRDLTEYLYDIEAIKPDSTVDRILEGKALVSPEVTR